MITRRFLRATEDQNQKQSSQPSSLDFQIKDSEKVKANNNQIWLYDDISDQSLYRLKSSLLAINQMYDLLQLQYYGMIKFKPVIHLHIASNGGCCFSGLHMYDTIKNNKYPVYTYIDGFIASAASLPFLAGVKRIMPDNGFIMIHQLSTWFVGTFQNLKDQYQNSTKVMNKFKQVYKKQLNMNDSQLEQMLKHDLWLNKQQAESYGFVKN